MNRTDPSGPDPGACEHCGVWIKAGMLHDCEAEVMKRDFEIGQLRQEVARYEADLRRLADA